MSIVLFGLDIRSWYSVLVFGLGILCGSSMRLDRLGRWLVLGLNLVRFALSLSMSNIGMNVLRLSRIILRFTLIIL